MKNNQEKIDRLRDELPYTGTPYGDLACAIVVQAGKDYLDALEARAARGETPMLRRRIASLEAFFASDWAALLVGGGHEEFLIQMRRLTGAEETPRASRRAG